MRLILRTQALRALPGVEVTDDLVQEAVLHRSVYIYIYIYTYIR